MKKIYVAITTAFFTFAFSTSQAQTTTTFNYTGAMQTFVVPACVTEITVDISGAEGGGQASVASPGGAGGRVQATMTVTPGQTLNIFVGGQGNLTGAAGYNGGGVGANGSSGAPGGGGGGASDIRINGTALTDRVIVAGGGGGGTENGGPAPGGHGGGLIGMSGSTGGNPWGCINFTAATGGTQSSGGLAGTSTSCAWDGTSGILGIGGNGYPVYRCSGGGGGWYGGGGAHNGAGGGGGSSYTDGSFTSVIHSQGYRLGDGIVILTYSPGAPAPSAITGATSICEGATTTYSIAPVVGATSYTWSTPAGTIINSGQGTTSINVTVGNSSGNVTVYASSPCGSSPTTSLTITVAPAPTVSVTAASGTICIGNSDVLTASGASTYVWSSGGTTATETVSPTTMTTYTVTGTGGNGCTNTATVMVMVNALPTVSATAASGTICIGNSDVLTASGASTYVWSSGGTASTETVSPTTMTTYTVTGTDVNGCTNTATVMVMVNTLPTVSATAASGTICSGNSDVLTASGASTYIWSSGGTAATETVSPTTMTTYTVTGTDGNGCTNTATVMVMVNPLPVVALGNDSTQCGGTITLNAGNAGSTYLWNDATTNQTLIASATGTYSVTVTDANGCMNNDEITITINTNPVVNLGNDVEQCGGGVILNAGNPGSTYLWNTTAVTQIITPSSSGTYYVDVIDVNGCTGSDTVMLTIHTPPTVTGTATSTTVCFDDASVVLTGTPAGGTWSGPGVTGSSFDPSVAGNGAQTVTYTFSDANNCTGTAPVTIQVNACVGVVEATLENGVTVFPNPNNGSFTISFVENTGDVKIEIVDMQGRVVSSSMENNVQAGFAKQISMENVAEGIYIIRMTTSNEQRIVKVSVQE